MGDLDAERLTRMETQQTNIEKKLDQILAEVSQTTSRVSAHDIALEVQRVQSAAQAAKVESLDGDVKRHQQIVDKLQGAWWAATILAGVLGAIVAVALEHFWR